MKLKKENGKTILVFENDEVKQVCPSSVDYYEQSIASALDITDFEVHDDNPKYISIDGIIYTKDGLMIVAVPCGKSGCIKIREGVEIIKDSAFDKSAASKVICPQSLRLIDKYAFRSSIYLTEIDDFNGNSDNVKRTWYLQSDANGIVRFDDNHVVTSLTQYRSDEFFKFNNNIVLPYYGQLRFTEVSTPASYVLNSEPFVVNLADAQNGSTVDLSKTVYNDLEPAKVQLTKYKDDGSPLAGVEFELKFVKESETATKNKSESFSRLLNVGETATATTDADGKITWENLDQGDYEIRETKTVDGCALLTDVIKVTLPLQLTKDEADSYGNVNKDLAKEDTNYTKKWYFFDCKYEIKNNQVFLMPMTGSDGTWMYGFVGFAAIAFTGCLYLLLDEKKKNKRKHRRKRR